MTADCRVVEATQNALLREIDKLARAGAEFGLLASNTPHVVFADGPETISRSGSVRVNGQN